MLVPPLLATRDLDATLAGFLALGITIAGGLAFGRRWWPAHLLIAAAVLLILLLAPDAYAAFGLMFLVAAGGLGLAAVYRPSKRDNPVTEQPPFAPDGGMATSVEHHCDRERRGRHYRFRRRGLLRPVHADVRVRRAPYSIYDRFDSSPSGRRQCLHHEMEDHQVLGCLRQGLTGPNRDETPPSHSAEHYFRLHSRELSLNSLRIAAQRLLNVRGHTWIQVFNSVAQRPHDAARNHAS